MIGEGIHEEVLRALVEEHAVRDAWWPRSTAAPIGACRFV